jgi:outer membrane protein OmpA-like peptidoglycan-associated protein
MGQLIDALSTAVAPARQEALARLLGDTPETTGKALALAVPALLAALANRATHGGMDEVMALAGPVLAGGDPLDRVAAALADSGVRGGLMDEGHALVEGLLGSDAGALAAALSQATGTRAHSVAEVLKLAGPIGLGVVARQLGAPLTADRLAALLEAERPRLLAALPPAVAARVAATEAEPVPLHGTAVEGAAGAARNAARWLPWLAALAVAIVVVASVRAFQRDAARPAAPALSSTPIITEGPVPLAEARLPDGSVLMLPEGSAALELATLLSAQGDGARRSIRLEGETDEAVHAVASVLKGWPAVTVRIEGHGTGAGDAADSLAESTARAQAVRDLLAADGVPADHVVARGVGNAEPIATTETAEGRSQNRRTLIIITAA